MPESEKFADIDSTALGSGGDANIEQTLDFETLSVSNFPQTTTASPDREKFANIIVTSSGNRMDVNIELRNNIAALLDSTTYGKEIVQAIDFSPESSHLAVTSTELSNTGSLKELFLRIYDISQNTLRLTGRYKTTSTQEGTYNQVLWSQTDPYNKIAVLQGRKQNQNHTIHFFDVRNRSEDPKHYKKQPLTHLTSSIAAGNGIFSICYALPTNGTPYPEGPVEPIAEPPFPQPQAENINTLFSSVKPTTTTDGGQDTQTSRLLFKTPF